MSGLRPVSAEPADARRRGAAASTSSRRRPGRCSSTSWSPAARRPPGRPGTRCCPRTPRRPAEELLARRLLVPRSGGVVVLPGEVGLALRGGHTTTEPVDEVPELATAERGQAMVDRAAAGAAFEAVRRVELLLDAWGLTPAELAAQRRPRRPRPQGDRRPAARRRADRGAAGRGGLGRRAARDRRRPGRQPGVDPDRRVRRLDGPADRRALDRAGPGLAGEPADARAGRVPRPAGQGVERARPELAGSTRSRAGGWRSDALAELPAGRGARHRAPASRRWSAGSSGCGRAGRAPAPTRSRGRSTRPRSSASSALGGLASYARALLAERRAGRDRRRWRRCCPSRSTTCCSRPT